MNRLILLLPVVMLPSCVQVRVEFADPLFKAAGLKGKTLAVGEVVSTHWENDPPPFDSAVILHASEQRLREKRPQTTVIGSIPFERVVGELHNRPSPSDDLPRRVVSSAQAGKARARNINYVLLVEVTRNQVDTSVSRHEETKTDEERDKDGKVIRECKTTTYITTAHATRRVGTRFYILDTRTRETVWQAVSNHLHCNENSVESGSWSYQPTPAVPMPPPMSDVAVASMKAVIRKLPK